MSRGATDNHQPTDPWQQAASVGRLFFFSFTFQAGLEPSVALR